MRRELPRRSQVFLPVFDFNERPSRNAMRLIASGERPRIFAACSSEAEDFANSMSRRSSLNDQGLRAITKRSSRRHNDKAAKRTHIRSTALLGRGRALGEPGARDG